MSYIDHRSREHDRGRDRDRDRGIDHHQTHHHNNRSRSNDHHTTATTTTSSSSHHYNQHHGNNNSNSRGGNNTNSNATFDDRDKYAGDYISICLKNLNETLTDTDLSESIYREFKKYGNFNVKVVYDRNMRDRRAERIAFINFDSHEQAKAAKRSKINIIFHGLPLYIEPVFRNRSNAPDKHIYQDYHHHHTRAPPAPPPPPPPPHSHHYSKSNRVNTPPLPSRGRNRSRSLSISDNSSLTHESNSRKRSNSSKNYTKLQSSTSTSSKSRRNKSRSLSPPSRAIKHLKTSSSRNKYSQPPPPLPQSRRQHYQRDAYPSSPPPSPPPPQSYHHQHHHHHNRHAPPPPPSPPPPPPSYNRHDYNNFDKEVTRTLFIGNLDPDISETELKNLFDRFGYIEEIDIKRQPNKKPYAFIKYINSDMAYNAKIEMSDKLIGKYESKIGYGKLQPTQCLWIGGLNSLKARKRDLEKYFGRYGKIKEIDWSQGDEYAYILYDNINDAEDARNGLISKYLPNVCSQNLRIDYGDPKRFDTALVGNKIELKESSVSRSPSVSKSKTRSRSGSPRSVSRSIAGGSSRSRSITRSRSYKSASRSSSRSVSRSEEAMSQSPSNLQSPTTHSNSLKRASHNISSTSVDYQSGNENEQYSSNDEKAYKKQKLSSTAVSKKVSTPPPLDLQNESNQSRNSRHRHNGNGEEHFENEKQMEQMHEIDKSKSEKEDEDELEESNGGEKNQLIKEALISKDVQLSRIMNIGEINSHMKQTWSGVFTLKKIAFPTKFYLLAGNRCLAEQLLPIGNVSSSSSSLKITQRLRLDPSKVEELEKKLYDSNYIRQTVSTTDSCTFSVLIALPHETGEKKSKSDLDISDASGVGDNENDRSLQQRSLHNLIIYLNQKSAAGVIPLPDDDRPTAIVHAFPPNCQFSIKLLKQLLPNLTLPTSSTDNKNSTTSNYTSNSDYLIIVLLKN